MIKKVKVQQLRPGVFIKDYDCGWLGHPFLFGTKLLKNDKAIKKLEEWGVKEVFIDTEKGLDIEESPTLIENYLRAQQAPEPSPKKNPLPPRVPIQEEIRRAHLIKREARQIVHTMIKDIRAGRKIKINQAYDMLEKMENSIQRNKEALAYLVKIRKKDEYTLMHSISVSALMLLFANALGLKHEQRRKLGLGALLHDVGKIMIPDTILNKPSKLSETEFEEMKRHCEYCAHVFGSANDLPEDAFNIAMQHHERFDGTGYPGGFAGKEISPAAQMAAIVDVYDAITADRCYKSGILPVEGIRKIYEWRLHHFNKGLAESFVKCVGVYPVGTVVRMESGLLGIVLESTEILLKPRIRLFYNEKKSWFVPVKDVNLSLSAEYKDDRITGFVPPDKWKIDTSKIFSYER